MRPGRDKIIMISIHGYVSAAPELGKPDTGGQVVYVLEIARCLGRMGFEVDILTRRFEDQPAVDVVQDGVRVVRIPCGGVEFIPKETIHECLDQWVENAYPYLRKQVKGIAFINSHYWDAGVAGMQLAECLSLPHLHTPHSLGVWKRENMPGKEEEKEQRYNFRHRIMEERRIYQQSQALIATTPQQKEILLASEYSTPEARIRVIPPGYDDTRFFAVSEPTRQAIKRELGMEGKIVLALGRTARNKGYDLLVRSMAPVFERVPDARLLLAVGSTQPTESEEAIIAELRQIAKQSGFADRVMIQDYIPDDRLADYYRAADVFALSSRYEPVGMTAIEAMASGIPTVITTQGGLWDQVTWGVEAVYANPNDPDAFGHAITQILSYPALAAQLAENGAKKARSSFTWTGITQQIVNLAEETRSSANFPVNPAPIMK